MRTYTFDELVERYDLSKAGFSKFFHTNEDKLIKDGQKHYRIEGKRVFFDDIAVEIMDQLRGLNKDIISAKEETANEIRIRELLEENSTLKTRLLLLEEEDRVDKERIIKLTEENSQVKLLAERNKNITEQVDAIKNELSVAEAEKAELMHQHQILQQQVQTLQQQVQVNYSDALDYKAKLETEMKKSWWQKIFKM